MERSDELPPKPDELTGEPRPPEAPLVESMGRTTHEQDHESSGKGKPDPPEGRGPVLEWHRDNQRAGIKYFFVGFLFIVIVGTIREWSFWWMSVWWIWLFPVALGLIFYFYSRRDVVAAGVDWYKKGKHWVDTYDLKSVKIKAGPGRLDLEMDDRSGRGVTTTCLLIEKNRKLWDLVYNGIVHSAKHHHVETNKTARHYLNLPL